MRSLCENKYIFITFSFLENVLPLLPVGCFYGIEILILEVFRAFTDMIQKGKRCKYVFPDQVRSCLAMIHTF